MHDQANIFRSFLGKNVAFAYFFKGNCSTLFTAFCKKKQPIISAVSLLLRTTKGGVGSSGWLQPTPPPPLFPKKLLKLLRVVVPAFAIANASPSSV